MKNYIYSHDLDIDLKALEIMKDPTDTSNILKKRNLENNEDITNNEYPYDEYEENEIFTGKKNKEFSNKIHYNNNNELTYKTKNSNNSNNSNMINNSTLSIPKKNKLFNIKTIIGDKNSLYRAVSENILASEEDYMMLKFFIAHFACRKNELEDLYNNFYMEEFSLTFYEYLDRIKDDNFLVGEFDLIMLAKILNIDITIYNLNSRNNSSNKEMQINLNNDYSIYSNIKIVDYIKCTKPFYKIDLLFNNIDDINDRRNTYHLITFNKSNPYFEKLLKKKNEFINTLLSDIKFYDIKQLENPNYIRDFYFSNYSAPVDVENKKSRKKLFFNYPNFKISEDMKLTLIVIILVLAFLTLRRMF